MIIDKPKLLSIHPTMQCDYGCYNCYLKAGDELLKEKDPEFFLGLVDVAKKVGMTDVAIPLNYVKKTEDFRINDKNFIYYNLIRQRAIDNSLDFTITCNYEFVENYKNDIDLSKIVLSSISVNDFVTPTDVDKNKAIETMRFMRSLGSEVNCNILMSPNMIKLLNLGLAEKILEVSNTIFLLSSQPLYIPLEKVYGMIRSLDPRLMAMLGDRILLDSCIRREMGLTGGLCSKHDFIYVNPYGEIKQCSYDQRNLSILEKPEDLEYIYSKYPSEPLTTCDLVNGKYATDKKLQMKTARVLSSR